MWILINKSTIKLSSKIYFYCNIWIMKCIAIFWKIFTKSNYTNEIQKTSLNEYKWKHENVNTLIKNIFQKTNYLINMKIKQLTIYIVICNVISNKLFIKGFNKKLAWFIIIL